MKTCTIPLNVSGLSFLSSALSDGQGACNCVDRPSAASLSICGGNIVLITGGTRRRFLLCMQWSVLRLVYVGLHRNVFCWERRSAFHFCCKLLIVFSGENRMSELQPGGLGSERQSRRTTWGKSSRPGVSKKKNIHKRNSKEFKGELLAYMEIIQPEHLCWNTWVCTHRKALLLISLLWLNQLKVHFKTRQMVQMTIERHLYCKSKSAMFMCCNRF